MNLERRIARLNKRLEEALGRHPLYAWKQAEAVTHPAIHLNDDGTDKMEYVCQCGVDVWVHKPFCKMTLARKKVSIERVLPDEKWDKRWVLCCLEFRSESEWRKTFGTHVTFPANGQWQPATFTIGISGGHIKTAKGQEPNEAITEEVIRRVRMSREMTLREKTGLIRDMKKQREDRQRQENYEFLTDLTHASKVLNLIPGRKGHSSFATPQRQQGVSKGASA